jgi:hypothetical protein
MSAYNVVRFRVKSGREQAFIDTHKRSKLDFGGFRKGSLIKTGDRDFCFIGEWNGYADIVAARPAMIAFLETFRGDLEDLGNDLGVTDPVSGPVVADIAG